MLLGKTALFADLGFGQLPFRVLRREWSSVRGVFRPLLTEVWILC